MSQAPGEHERVAAQQADIGPESVLTCKNCGAKNRIRPRARGVPTCGKCGETLPWLVNATDTTFEPEADAAVTVVVDLWAPWCGPCRFVSPILEELSREYAGRLKVVKVNVDENPQIVQKYGILLVPTLSMFSGGEVVKQVIGARSKSALLREFTEFF